MKTRLVAVLVAAAVLAGPACARKNEDKLALQEILQASAHSSGIFRYSDRTETTPLGPGSLVQVRGLIEDDFRFKARLTVDGQDALDEVVADDALAVRFLDPSYVPKFTTREGDAATRAALAARYWVTDPVGAPSVGDAAVADRVIGVDPIVDSLSVIEYAVDAISAAAGVAKFNPEGLDYRPSEDPFPRPARGSGVTRWDVYPPDMPRADALETGQGNASLARVHHFRKMAVYVKDGRVVQIREKIAAEYDLLDRFRNYIVQFVEKADENAADALREELEKIEDQPDVLEAVLNLALNELLGEAGEDPVRFRTMVYEFTVDNDVEADLPFGPDVKEGSLAFFGVNSQSPDRQQVRRRVNESGDVASTSPESTTTTTAGP